MLHIHRSLAEAMLHILNKILYLSILWQFQPSQVHLLHSAMPYMDKLQQQSTEQDSKHKLPVDNICEALTRKFGFVNVREHHKT